LSVFAELTIELFLVITSSCAAADNMPWS